MQSVQTTALFSIGWLDRISPKAIESANGKRAGTRAVREFVGDFTDVPVGRVPYTADGRVGKFGWKRKFATLEEFVSAACANEIGLGTSLTPQATPLHKAGVGSASPDLTRQQIRELLAFVDTLPRPVEVPSTPAAHGKTVFGTVGCAICHTPDIGGVNGVYSDFLLYTLDDPMPAGGLAGYGPPPANARPDFAPAPQEWKTPPLWGGGIHAFQGCGGRLVVSGYEVFVTSCREYSMLFDSLLQPFLDKKPVAVLARATLEHAFASDALDELFRTTATQQSQHTILSSRLVELLTAVVTRRSPSVPTERTNWSWAATASAESLAAWLLRQAEQVEVHRYAKTTRGPRKPGEYVKLGRQKPHRSTARLLKTKKALPNKPRRP